MPTHRNGDYCMLINTNSSPSSFLFYSTNNLIQQCKTTNQLYQLHAHAIAYGLLSLPSSSQFLTKLLYTVTTLIPKPTETAIQSSSSLLRYVVSIFNSIIKPSTFCYNVSIRAHILLSSPLAALRFFAQMRRLSVRLDSHSFPFALKACAQVRVLSLAKSLHCQVLRFGFSSDLFVVNSLIHVYCRGDSLKGACQVFDESSVRDVVSYCSLVDGFVKVGDVVKARELFDMMPFRDAVSWGTLIAGYAQRNHCKEAIELFNVMMDSEIRPCNVALVSALSACAQLGELEKGKRIHDYIQKNAIQVDSFLSTGLVDLYAKCGCIDKAIKVFEMSHDKTLCTWNAMLVGLAMHGDGRLLLRYFSRMVVSGIKPDGISILGVLAGCSHGGLVNEARKLFGEMESVYGVPRELKHYGCMADLLSRAGLIEEAMEMIKKMPMNADIFVWSSLLGGCRIHRNVEVAEKAAKHVMELKPEDGGVYSIMADIYANAERWEEVVNVRKSMSGNEGVIKNSAWSSIQLDGVMHEFVSGDRLHPRAEDMYLVLNGIKEHQFELH
ncbi:hypothetical protein K2173_027647 [Erythroxylum novogranatense]|uniref:Chlororespiratory reduction 4 n=1 Tax=Erythroxylum novogranatense TaxID=1862640 RepID=A0AAV8U373_9ROSI|nr:hypothetical protein K2173_027647 [Erythroxylum novogranatense]